MASAIFKFIIMILRKLLNPGIIIALFMVTACNNNNDQAKTETTETATATKEPKLKEENITYEGDGATMKGFVVYDENNTAARPAVLVVHEWWGLVEYSRMRARELAKLGYVAMAIDMFGNGDTAANPQEAMKATDPYYKDPQKAKRRFDAALAKLKSYSQVDQNNIAAIGYCFGGTQVLNMAKLGDDLKAVVSFHGGMPGITPTKDVTKAKILVCHGGDDKFVSAAQVDQFRKSLDSVGVTCSFKVYPGATHAFTNPASTEKGKKFSLPIAYNPAADSASWKDMKEFFDQNLK
jgi:dienelactone hydrolase